MGKASHSNAATSVEELPYGAMKRVRGVPKWGVEPHANAATGAFAEGPYGATEREGCADMGV
eukprot:5063930-Pyramimonas_sp.AAC.1